MNNKAVRIKEVFESVQGEGPYIGYKQIFVRFCNCNLKCNYCDTEFAPDEYFEEFTPIELADYLKKFDLHKVHSVSLTGGEPLLSVDFLKEFLPFIAGVKVYLETNATLADKLAEVINFIDIIAADIKLESASGIKDSYKFHDNFFEVAKKKDCFAKIVFNSKITGDEIEKCALMAKKHDIPLILQPEMHNDKLSVSTESAQNILNKFLELYPDTRLIPQMHKFLNLR